MAASRDCGLGPAWRKRRSSTAAASRPRGVPGSAPAAAIASLLGLGVEVAHQRRAVVLRDERDERLGQLVLVGEVDAVGDVRLRGPPPTARASARRGCSRRRPGSR